MIKFRNSPCHALFAGFAAMALGACSAQTGSAPGSASSSATSTQIYGTDNAFASEAIYFLLTDRFVDGDPSNNQVDQGKPGFKTFDRHLPGPGGQHDNIGYLGGDFKGIIDNADYITEMGFTALWTTPIVDNPDAAYSGSEPVKFGSGYQDGGKTGYHGYWAVNFYKVDEHLPSPGLQFQDFTAQLRDKHGLKYILDIVANHGSPSYTMPVSQPEFGKLYDGEGRLVADHQNLHPEQLDPNNPLHRFFNRKPGLATLSDLDPDNPDVMDYLMGSYEQWLDQGVYALRIDTFKEQPHYFWKKLGDRIRAKRPDIFMFGESFSFDANFLGEHTRPENGGFSVLDFPGRAAMKDVFENPASNYDDLKSYLHLTDNVYRNPYELVTFYDNHDMSRLNASDEGFIDANNWLFTSRGIPAFYYGSETGFMRGTAEHFGNRNYYGQERIDAGRDHPIRQNLIRIANLRKAHISLQKGVQINVDFGGQRASFYRIYQKDGVNETALVMLNKGDETQYVTLDTLVEPGEWRDAFTGEIMSVGDDQLCFSAEVPAHGVRVFIKNKPVVNKDILQQAAMMTKAVR